MKYLLLLTVLFLPLSAFAADFVPLTSIPLFSGVENADSFSLLLNNLYKICIGAAAVLAVFQIIRAGIVYMLGGSITEVKEARNLITVSVLGLILVLSPVIVFSIIDPRILELDINTGSLQTTIDTTSTPTTPAICQATIVEKKILPIPTNKDCKDIPEAGPGWVGLDAACCTGTVETGFKCCGKDPNYVPPPVTPNEQAFHYTLEYEDDAGAGACRSSATYGFATKEACVADVPLKNKYPNTAMVENCDGASVNPPTPTAEWDKIKNLPVCE